MADSAVLNSRTLRGAEPGDLEVGGSHQMVAPSRPAVVQGIGIHSGAECTVTLQPAEHGEGVSLVSNSHSIAIALKSVVSTRRCTTIGNSHTTCATVEHLFSALQGLHVTDLRIIVEGPEIPILDGSAQPWVHALTSTQLQPTHAQLPALTLSQPTALKLGDSWYAAVPANTLHVTCISHFDHPMLGTDIVTFSDLHTDYSANVAPARTFGFTEEIEKLLNAGLARGGTIENALVIYHDRFSSPLRMPMECANHKLLDLLGDLFLCRTRIAARITAIRPGHTGNIQFAKQLLLHAAAPA